MMQGCEMGLRWDPAEGESLSERSQKLPHKQNCDLTGSGWAGLDIILQRGTHKQCFPIIYATPGGAFDLSCERGSMSHNKLFHHATDLSVLHSEQALSTIVKQVRFVQWSLLPMTSSVTIVCFCCCWILNVLKVHPSGVKVPPLSLISLMLSSKSSYNRNLLLHRPFLFSLHFNICSL